MTTTNVEKRFKELRDKILPVLSPYGVVRLALFGSIVRGEETPESDVDILVLFEDPRRKPLSLLTWVGLEEELGHILGRKVELVSESALSPYIRPYVEREKVTLYDAKR
jgi:predicted nucleotidyltransferase